VTADAPPPAQPPVPRARTPRTQEIVAAARDLLEVAGWDGVTMRRLAAALGIQAPSLYKHIAGKRALEVALVEVGLEEMGAALHGAVSQSSGPALADLLRTYRTVGLANPALYRLVTSGSFPRAALLPGLEAWAGEPFFLAVGDPHLAQAVWSFAHGMVILELDGRFLERSALDRTWHAGMTAFAEAARSAPASHGAGGDDRRHDAVAAPFQTVRADCTITV